jgi:hypothetical protein
MTDYVIAYTGPRGGKPKYQVASGDDPKSAMNRFIETTEKTYVEQVYAPVDAAAAPPAEATREKLEGYERAKQRLEEVANRERYLPMVNARQILDLMRPDGLWSTSFEARGDNHG